LIENTDLENWYGVCHQDVCHNQQIFTGDLQPRLNTVLQRIFS